MAENQITVGIIIASDKGSRGERVDGCIPEIEKTCSQNNFLIKSAKILSDDEEGLYNEIVRLCDDEKVDLVLTSGGTGFSARDNTPEATLRAATKNVPGIAEAVRANSMQYTKRAMLSRAVSVIRNSSLIINLPGSPKAVRECLDFLFPDVIHGIQILKNEVGECGRYVV